MIELETEEEKLKKKKKKISEYYNFYQGENEYFGELQEYHNINKKEYLKKLQTDYKNVNPIDSKDLIYSDEDDNVDLAFYDGEYDNIQGLKKLIKKLIDKANTKKVKKVLKNLLAEIIPITDVAGEALKSMGFITMYDELIEMYNKRKEYVENNLYGNLEDDDQDDEFNENENDNENENENKNKNVDNQNEKSQSKSFRLARNNLMVRLFSKQAAEMGLELIDDSDDEAYKKLDEKLNSNSNNEWDNENESEDYDLNYNYDDYDNDFLEDYTLDNENDNEDYDLEEESDDVYEPKVDSEDNDEENSEFNSDNIEEDATEQQYQYELLRSDYIQKIESRLMWTIASMQTIKNTNNDTNNDNTDSIIRTLLMLLKNEKNNVDIVALRNLYMANIMYKENIGKSLYDVSLDNDKINELESDIFDNEVSLHDKEENSPPTPFKFTRFISRFFYIIKKDISPKGFNPTAIRNELLRDDLYKKLYTYDVDENPEELRNYLDELDKALSDAMASLKNDNKDKEKSKNKNEIYSTLRKYIKTIREKYTNKTVDTFFTSYVKECIKQLKNTNSLKQFNDKIDKIFDFADKK